jgi:hypothetical protein
VGPRDSPAPLPADQRDYSAKAEVKICVSCGEESVQADAEAWMCLVVEGYLRFILDCG